MRRLLLIILTTTAISPAFAQSVDGNGAKALAETLSKYFGRSAIENNIVSVAPEGDSYRISLDTAKLLGTLPSRDYLKGDLGDYSLLARPLADGTWNVSSLGMPGGSIEMATPKGKETLKWSFENPEVNGVFDPKLGAFSKANFSYGSFRMTLTSPEEDMDASAGSAEGETAAIAAPSGGIDITTTQSAKDFAETIQLKSPPAESNEAGTPDSSHLQQPLQVAVRGAELAVAAQAKGLRNLELLDLWAFVVAQADKKSLTNPEQADFKAKLTAAMPLWDKLIGSYRFGDLRVETPLGRFAANKISQEMDFDGIGKNGGYHYALRTNGLEYPVLPMPEWAVPFLPTDVELAFGAEGVDLDTLARAAIADMDLNRDKPFSDEFEATAAAAFMSNPPKIVIDRSLVRTADSEITVEGEVSFAGLKPTSRTTWEMAGFDAAIDRLNKAAEKEPEAKNYVIFAKLAKDFGTQLSNERIQWVVDQKADGSISVNGNPVKGPDPLVGTDNDDGLDGTTPDDNVIVPDGGQDDGGGTPPAQ